MSQPVIVPEGNGRIYDHDVFNRNKIYYTHVDENLTHRMLTHAKEVETKSPDLRFDLAGALDREKVITFKEDMNLYADVNNMIAYHLSEYIKHDIRSISVERYWVNFMVANEFNPLHSHSGLYSFVWYLDIPEVIRQEWQNDHPRTKNACGLIEFMVREHNHQDFMFNPRTSDFFLFTSDHMHTVYPFRSEGVTRISMSGNVTTFDLFEAQQ